MKFGNLFKKGGDDDSIESSIGTAATAAPKDATGYPVPSMPSLSLAPQSRITLLARRRAVRKVLMYGTFVVAGLAVVTVGLVVTLFASKAAEDSAIAARDVAQADVDELSPVADLYEGFEARQKAVASALASDVDYYRLVTDVQTAIQAEIPRDALMEDVNGEWYVKEEFGHIGLGTYSVQATPCPTDVPFEPEPALGCLSGTATSSSPTAAAEAIRLLNDNPDNGLFGGYILSASANAPVGEVGSTSWNFTINYGATALSGKYSDLSIAILGGATTDPSPSASPSATPSAEEEN